MQRACAILLCDLWAVWLYNIFFFTLFQKQKDCWEEVTEHEYVFLLSLQIPSEKFLILRKISEILS